MMGLGRMRVEKSRRVDAVRLPILNIQYMKANTTGSGFICLKGGCGGLMQYVVQRELYLGENVALFIICRTMGGEGSNGNDGL